MPTIDELRSTVTKLLGDGAAVPADDDDLIASGLDSLRIMRLADNLRRAGFDVGFADLVRTPSLAAWAELVAAVGADPEAAAASDAAPAIAPADGTTPFALAPMQHAYWIGRGGDQELGAVGAHLYTEFDGTGVDADRLGHAVKALTARHPMLRVRVRDDGRQVIDPPHQGAVISVCDLQHATPAEVDARLQALRDELSHQMLDLERGQVFDVRLTLLPDGRSRVHIDVDFLAADARSYRTLLSELAQLYEDPDVSLPELRYTYPQYLDDRRAEPARAEDARWWRDRLGELPGAPELPARRRSGDMGGDVRHVTRLHRHLEPAARMRLTEQARRHGVTPAVAVATAFAEAIGAFSGRPRFLLNVPMFDRRPLHPEVDGIVGDFTSSVMLDVDLHERMPFADRARDVQRRLHAAVAHGSHSGLDVLRDLSRAEGAPVLAPVVFTSALSVGELFGAAVERCLGEPVWIVSQGPQVILDAQVSEFHDGLLVNWDVRTGVFPDGVPDAMFAGFADVLDAICEPAGWEQPVATLAPTGQLAVRAKVNATAGPLPTRTLHAGFFAHAAHAPDALAVLGAGGPLTYGTLADRALRVAGWLAAAGVAAGDAVAVRLPRGPEQVVAVLGILARGAQYVPVDPAQPEARAERMMSRAGTTAVLDTGRYAEAVAFAGPVPAPEPTSVDATAYVIFTSGSTGEPKGVEITHAQAANTIDDLIDRYGIGPADRTLGLSALDFDLSVLDLFAPLAVGGAVVLVGEDDRREARAWVSLAREHRVTIVNAVPPIVDLLLRAGEQAPLPASLRLILTGGDWVGTDLPGRLAEQRPGARFVALGGATEASIYSNCFEVEGPAPADWASIPYGTPLRNQRFRIADAQGRDCPDWVAGELWIGGAGVAVGYRGDPERTAASFVDHDGERWYRTGDRARYRPDGIVEFLGREDDQVKLRGFRIELGEVEAAVAEHPGVQAVAALVDRSGPSAQLLVAAVATVDAQVLGEHAAARLPDHMVPDRVLVLDALPLTRNGKVDRRALATLPASAPRVARHVPPRTALEAAIAHVWSEVLGGADVGVEDDLFLLGGDSLLATIIVGRLREGLATDRIAVRDVLVGATVAALATRLIECEAAAGGDASRLEAAAALFLEVENMSEDELDAALLEATGTGS